MGLRGVVEHIGDLGIEVHKNDVLKESIQTDENDAADYDADDDLDCGIDIAFAGLGRKGVLVRMASSVALELILLINFFI